MDYLGVVFLLVVVFGCLYAFNRTNDKNSALVLGLVIGLAVAGIVQAVVEIADR